MGFWNERYLEQHDRDYSLPSDRFVCPACVADEHLARALVEHLIDRACSYCGASRAADISVLLDELNEAFRVEYTDPADELPFETREGGYQGQVYDGFEVVETFYSWTDNLQLLEEAADAFAGSAWCRVNYFGLTPYEALSFGWASFSEQVKHRTRYLFLQDLGNDDDMGDPDAIPPGRMLNALGNLFLDFGLVAALPKGTEFVRARVAEAGERPSTAAELGTAPFEFATNPNRMSPAGIPMFYAAFDEATAVLETYQPEMNGDREIALARFRTARSLRFVDLTSLPVMPSIFDRENRVNRHPIAFLKDFEHDLTQPVARDKMVHIEYVPTQVVTEFVRHRLQGAQDERFDGILYRSSRAPASKAAVIFADPDQCGPSDHERPFASETLLILDSVRYARPNEFGHLWSAN
jgi:hypothetical protein